MSLQNAHTFNRSQTKIEIVQANYANTIVTDALVPYITKSRGNIVLTKQ